MCLRSATARATADGGAGPAAHVAAKVSEPVWRDHALDTDRHVLVRADATQGAARADGYRVHRLSLRTIPSSPPLARRHRTDRRKRTAPRISLACYRRSCPALAARVAA